MNLRELTVEKVHDLLEEHGYICERELAVTVYLALKMEKPLLVEGAPGVGKTEVAKVLSRAFNYDLIRLQCYEGLDENKALYEWNYQKQLLKIQIHKEGMGGDLSESDLFSNEYLLERPLLRALRSAGKTVLLIDEVDKVEEEFEAFLFELLSDFQVSIPEMGTLSAVHIPVVVLTSNKERELSDGLKRRCLYLYIDYPSVEKEVRIIITKVPEVAPKLAREVAQAVGMIRSSRSIWKKPSISESIDWARALAALGAKTLDQGAIKETLGVVLKNREDMETVMREVGLKALAAAAQRV